MDRRHYGGYNQSKGGYNALSGYKQFIKADKPEEDDTTNPQAEVKLENIPEEDNIDITQQVVGDVSMVKGDGLDKVFTREKVADTPNEKVGYDENIQLNAK